MFHRLLLSPIGNATILAVAAFLVYLKTLAPSVTFIDSGELAAVSCTLGIAHPTGYPLFTLLGWFFSKLPIASEEIVRLNIMAALFCALGVFFFYLVMHFISNRVAGTQKVKGRKRIDNFAETRIASACAALLLAFSETYWSQAVSIEVYSLHVLLLSIVCFAFLRAAYGNQDGMDENAPTMSIWWIVFSFSLGLSFTNHMTTILLAPGLMYLYFATQGYSARSWRRIAWMGLPFTLGLSVYMYLPFRAMSSPLLNWGNPSTLEKFLWHWTGKQYRVWIFSSTEAAGRQLKYFMNALPSEFAYVGMLLALAGLVVLLRSHRQLAVGVLLLFLGCVFYSINYDIHDIDSYFLLAYWCIALFAGFGVLGISRWLVETMRMKYQIVSAFMIVVCLAPLAMHFDKTDETNNWLVEDYTMNMFSSVENNSLVISYQWDYWVSASFYYQLVKNVRPDVVVIDKELLRRSWYIRELEYRYPWLIENSRAHVDAFLDELYKFEHELPYDTRIIEGKYVAMIRSFILSNMGSRPVYVTGEIEPEFMAGMQGVPEGLAIRIYGDTLKHEMRNVSLAYRPFGREGRLEDGVRNLYAVASNAQGVYWLQNGNADLARAAFRKALEFNPQSAEARNLLMQTERMRPR